jgi:fructose-bisphosphate aldolase class II
MEQGIAILEAAKETNSPVIIQASRGARAYAGDLLLGKLVEGLEVQYPGIPICLHQDHGNNEQTCASAIRLGFDSVMMDGSLKEDGATPADYDYNVAITERVTQMAHYVGVSVEGELGCLGSLETGMGDKEDGHGAEGVLSKEMLLTDPDQAAEFVAQTKVDALAVAIGTSHGAYKFSRKPTGDVLAMNVIEAIHKRLPDTHLVMHGSSSVPKELIDLINETGGAIPETFGVPVEEIQRGIRHGVRKINIDTDLRLAATAYIRKVLSGNKAEFDPRKYLKPAIQAMQKICKDRYEAFGTAGQASKIKIVPISEMAKRYAKGELDPKIAHSKAA